MSNYPSGVSGNEYPIAGPDYERTTDRPCPSTRDGEPTGCDGLMIEGGYRNHHWEICDTCGYQRDVENQP